MVKSFVARKVCFAQYLNEGMYAYMCVTCVHGGFSSTWNLFHLFRRKTHGRNFLKADWKAYIYNYNWNHEYVSVTATQKKIPEHRGHCQPPVMAPTSLNIPPRGHSSDPCHRRLVLPVVELHRNGITYDVFSSCPSDSSLLLCESLLCF